MTPDQVRAKIQAVEKERTELRAEMEAAVDLGGGHITQAEAEAFGRRLQDLEGTLWRLKSLLRTPAPSA